MLLTLKCMSALVWSGNTLGNHVIMPYFSWPPDMHLYLHEYYSVAKFKAAYATPIPALTDQSQWPEVDIEFSMCPPLTKRKAGRPKGSRFKAWFERGGSSKKGKGKKDGKPKRSQKGNKNRCKLCQELGHRAGSSKCCYTPKRPKRKCAAEPLVVEDCWPKKKKRGNGCRKKRSYGETMQTEKNEQDLDVLQNEQQDLDVFQNEDVVQNEQDLDVLQNQDVVQNGQDMDLVPNNYLPADVVQAEPILEVVLPNPVFPQDVVQNEQDMDLVPNDYLPADVVQAEPILEVVLPNPVFPKDVVPTKPILEVLLPTELDDIPADAVMKTKSLSELGIVENRSTDKKKKKKKLK
ncbi:uncharacterized protein LOC123446244 [Hordeum vulgare subsp. vulgare]|uniref:uncharacterized protein LOC123446244 n=1 Tax=Hordeum vulgare subsp. vulgare TaxID=112509 RepID=UPI001D1A3F2B|nr:uncharacterized protein LOC123446244 [Hordeum vulgare subsp. vulgare]